MITLQAIDLCWVSSEYDPSSDQCAHGRCSFIANHIDFIVPNDGEWTLSATALFLLRTLKHDHQINTKVAEGNFLFPCCAFTAWPSDGKFPVVCCGCPTGLDVWIKHENTEKGVEIEINSDRGKCKLPLQDWTLAVTQFADQITNFYDKGMPKNYIEDSENQEGWAAFWKEYTQMRGNAQV